MSSIKYLTKNQIDKLFSNITDPRDLAMLSLMYFYGLRRTEVCNLTLDDIDIDNQTIFIKALKNGISGKHFLTQSCIDKIKAYLQIRKNLPTTLPYLFMSKNKMYTKLAGFSIYRIYAKYAKLAELPKDLYNPHTLRHSLAVAMISSGFDLGFIKDLLRHASISSTTVYANIMTEAKLKMQENAFTNAEYFARV